MLSLAQAILQSLQQSLFSIKIESDFRDEDKIDIVLGQGSADGDVTGLAAHDFDQTDSHGGSLGLDMGRLDRLDGFGDGCVKAEGFFNEVQIVVDGFRNADDADVQVSPENLFGEESRRAHGPIPADAEKKIDVHPLERRHHLADILLPPRRGEDTPAAGVNVLDSFRGQGNDLVAVFGDQSLESITDTNDVGYAIAVMQFHHDGPDDVVEAGAQAAYLGKVSEYRRTVAQVPQESGPPFVVDIFRVRGGAVHDWSYHVEAGAPELAGVTLIGGMALGTEIPYAQLSDVRSGVTDNDWTATWHWPDEVGIRLWMCGSRGTQVNLVTAPGQRRRDEEGKRLPYLIVRRSGQDLASTFVCVHEPFRGAPVIRSVWLLEAEAGRAEWPVLLKVQADGKSWWVASKLSEGPWKRLPAAVPSLSKGRFAVRVR